MTSRHFCHQHALFDDTIKSLVMTVAAHTAPLQDTFQQAATFTKVISCATRC